MFLTSSFERSYFKLMILINSSHLLPTSECNGILYKANGVPHIVNDFINLLKILENRNFTKNC